MLYNCYITYITVICPSLGDSDEKDNDSNIGKGVYNYNIDDLLSSDDDEEEEE